VKNMKNFPIAVFVSGRGSNLKAIIQNIENGTLPGVEITMVLSDKPDAYALTIAKEAGIPCFVANPANFSGQKEYNGALAHLVKKSGAELVVLAGFMRLLTEDFLSQFPQRVINIHPALLPSFPGLHAQKQAWEYGVKVSGCTVHFVDAGADTGPIIAQKTVEAFADDSEEDLAARILKEEHILLSQVIGLIKNDKLRLVGRKVYID